MVQPSVDPWFEKSFGEDYMLIYKHRNIQGALDEVQKMVKWLNLTEGSEVLDLCCGMGRHAFALSDAGFKVTGIDLSHVLLCEAIALDKQRRIRWIQSDMRMLPEGENIEGTFDAVVNLFTSFGYFEKDEEQIKVLQQMERALKPHGKFIIDYLNAEYTKDHLIPFSERKEGETIIKENRRVRDGFVEKRIRLLEEGTEARQYEEQVKLYSIHRLTEMLTEANLSINAVYGDYDEGEYDQRLSPRMIIVGQRTE
ncbi:class I SAM-dependent methyltransferase [Paenibacillus wynnii]|uniref:SAM-dependent methyltransferase n=1 Tax=Paenibacillus wynnii TaxID=268407 RepID=A0A098M4R8_9BACL|nr:class I SAM-dependent methyltransferase [Paenibacillus wynnii]KGE17046.1 SAM-dependent methyltransferase [Paenibacillus wynnii]